MAVEAQVRQVGAQPDVDGQMPQPLEAVESAAGRLMRQGDDDLVDRLDSGEAGQILERAANGAALDFRRDPAAAIVEQPRDDDPRVVLPDLLDEMCCLRSGADQEQARGQPAGTRRPWATTSAAAPCSAARTGTAIADQSRKKLSDSSCMLPDRKANTIITP